MNSAALDASALLALLNQESGWEVVSEFLETAVVSTVNLAEVVGRLAAAGMPEQETREVIGLLALDVVAFDEERDIAPAFSCRSRATRRSPLATEPV